MSGGGGGQGQGGGYGGWPSGPPWPTGPGGPWPSGNLPRYSNRIPPEFYGVPESVLWQWHGEMQRCLQMLSVQRQVESISYSQNDGGRSVTYTRADRGYLEQRLRDLGRVLGINRPRRAITPIF